MTAGLPSIPGYLNAGIDSQDIGNHKDRSTLNTKCDLVNGDAVAESSVVNKPFHVGIGAAFDLGRRGIQWHIIGYRRTQTKLKDRLPALSLTQQR